MTDDNSCCNRPVSTFLDRRKFIKAAGLTTTSLALGTDLIAGPFKARDFQQLIPPDKKLNPDWLKSLDQRGNASTYSGTDLEKIGMPVSGICSGQVYLGGDGKLWHWDIFNRVRRTGVDQYAHPSVPYAPLDQGFEIQVDSGREIQNRTLDADGFSDIQFRGEYPIGYVEYRDDDCPVAVALRAFSPFIPLNTDDSSLPVIIMEFTVRNTNSENVNFQVGGWLQNLVCPHSGSREEDFRRNDIDSHPHITLLNCAAVPSERVNSEFDSGTMALGLLNPQSSDRAFAEVSDWTPIENIFLDDIPENSSGEQPFREKIRGALVRRGSLAPGAEATMTFVLTWHFANLELFTVIPGDLSGRVGRHYGNRFATAADVANYVAENADTLIDQTLLWHDTWYESSLPYWFLDRTFANTSILATNTCYRLANGRFYAFEGVGCCIGTCTSVWHYAQAVGRLFPELERSVREMQDYGTGFDWENGGINHRGEVVEPALDGQAGTILRAYREHQMAADDDFLRRNWPKIKRSVEWLIAADGNDDGLIEGQQSTTLDNGNWYGAMSWTSSLYLAALRAAEEMANELGDEQFAQKMHAIAAAGRDNIVDRLWNGEYFIHRPDLNHPNGFIIGNGCHSDQVFGQGWANQVGLGRILPEENVKSALRSIWKYNFTPDVGPYRSINHEGRWYAMPGEGGLIMTTWPQGDRLHPAAKVNAIGTGYLNECWTGFEYQVAGHMIAEGMVEHGLAITRMVHDRYHPAQRNPWNEIECGDHYARAMASYGVFVAACGYEYHGPMGQLGFSPRIGKEDFRAAFTAAEGWGSYTQKISNREQRHSIELKWGQLRLRTLTVDLDSELNGTDVVAMIDGSRLRANGDPAHGRIVIHFADDIRIEEDQTLTVTIS